MTFERQTNHWFEAPAEEEKRGLVRWLRPEYQAPQAGAVPAAEQQEIALAAGKTAPAAAVPAAKLSWPAALPAQVAALQKLLPALGPDPAALAGAFGARTKARLAAIADILETLRSLGKLWETCRKPPSRGIRKGARFPLGHFPRPADDFAFSAILAPPGPDGRGIPPGEKPATEGARPDLGVPGALPELCGARRSHCGARRNHWDARPDHSDVPPDPWGGWRSGRFFRRGIGRGGLPGSRPRARGIGLPHPAPTAALPGGESGRWGPAFRFRKRAGHPEGEAGGKSLIFPLRRGPDSAILAAPCQTPKKIPTIFGIRL